MKRSGLSEHASKHATLLSSQYLRAPDWPAKEVLSEVVDVSRIFSVSLASVSRCPLQYTYEGSNTGSAAQILIIMGHFYSRQQCRNQLAACTAKWECHARRLNLLTTSVAVCGARYPWANQTVGSSPEQRTVHVPSPTDGLQVRVVHMCGNLFFFGAQTHVCLVSAQTDRIMLTV